MKSMPIVLSLIFVLLLASCSQTTLVEAGSANEHNDYSVAASSTLLSESIMSSAAVSSQASQETFGSDGCAIHAGYYHAIDSRLIDYVGQEKMDAFTEKYGWEEENNIVNFVKFCKIDKVAFQKLIDDYDLNADAQYSGGNGYDADVIYSNDVAKVQEYYGKKNE